MKTTISISQAREDLPNIVDKAKHKLSEYIITVNGSPAAVIMSFAEYESWQETNEILADKALLKSIKAGEKDLQAGRMYDWDDIKTEFGFVNDADVQNKTYSTRKKRAKKD